MNARRHSRRGRRGPWVVVVGTRPNFVKLAPLVRAARKVRRRLEWIDTGQHVAVRLRAAMWRDLGLPPPHDGLEAPPPGPGRIRQLADRLAAPLAALSPSLVVVLGDVDSAVAGAIAAVRLGVPLAHVEAGLRSGEADLPEERNRITIDRLADLLHATEPSGVAHLRAEGVPARRIRLSGNVMADALLQARPALARRASELRGRRPTTPYVLATFHRQAHVDRAVPRRRWTAWLAGVAARHPVVLPLHPRTRARLGTERARLEQAGVRIIAPQPYLDFLAWLDGAGVLVTDSGGVQVEAALLGTPCLTWRRRTEHVLTIERGTNRLLRPDLRGADRALERALTTPTNPLARPPRAWDGRAASRIVADWAKGDWGLRRGREAALDAILARGD